MKGRTLFKHGSRVELRERRGRVEFRDARCPSWCPYTDQRVGRRDWESAGRGRCVENPAAMRAILEFETDSIEEAA